MKINSNTIKYKASIVEVLTGTMAAQYGVLPQIQLPQEDDLLIKFIHLMGTVLSDKGIYRRDCVIMLPDEHKARLNLLEAKVFCSWSQNHVVTYKLRYDKNGEPFTSYKDMPTELAEKVLLSPAFKKYVPEIEEVYPIPMLMEDESGEVKLAEPGFKAGRFTFEF